ncbi:MAG TPA: SAM-dependent methyltransferase [Streptosporangiaceae bacterium]
MNGIEGLPGIDPSKAHVARMYDYYLGGDNNFEADRTACMELDKLVPGTRGLAVNNRSYLIRVVRALATDYGIKQFIDIGTGLPTQNNVHQVAKSVHPDARVVYVDNDPLVSIHAKSLISDDESTVFLLEDVRNTKNILSNSDTRRLINFDEPVAALYISFLHQIPDRDDPGGLVELMMNHLATGSFLAISHLVSADPDLRSQLTDLMLNATQGNWGRVRTKPEVDKFFGSLEMLDPGRVEITTWRPDETAAEEQTFDWIEYGGVARKTV